MQLEMCVRQQWLHIFETLKIINSFKHIRANSHLFCMMKSDRYITRDDTHHLEQLADRLGHDLRRGIRHMVQER